MSIALDLPTKRAALRATDAYHHAKVHFGLAELGAFRCDDEIAHHCQLAATAQRIAGNRCDDRLAGTTDGFRQIGEQVAHERVDKAHLGHHGDVGARGECFFRSGDDDAAHLVIFLRLGDSVSQFAQQFAAERVQRVRAVQRDAGDVVVYVDDDRLIGHVNASICCRLRAFLTMGGVRFKLSLT